MPDAGSFVSHSQYEGQYMFLLSVPSKRPGWAPPEDEAPNLTGSHANTAPHGRSVVCMAHPPIQ